MSATISGTSMTITRVIPAPRALVFEAFTRADHIDRWWGPDGFSNKTQEMDVRVGGQWIYTMTHAEYGTFPNRIRYHEVVAEELLAYTHDEGEGGPEGFQGRIQFRDVDGGTEVSLQVTLATVEALQHALSFHADQGGEQNLAKLEVAMAEDAATDLVIERLVEAPVATVWAAWTEAARLEKWWGPKGYSVDTCTIDLRVGGMFHYAMTAPAGAPMAGTMWGRFVFHEVQPIHRLEYISSFSNAEGGIASHPMAAVWPAEIYNSLVLEAVGAYTKLTLRGRPIRASAESQAFFLQMRANVQAGFAGTFGQLTGYLSAL